MSETPLGEMERHFLLELTRLTRRTGIAVHGCGCCGSPFLKEVALPEGSGYAVTPAAQIVWVEPGDAYDWNHYRDAIVKEKT